MKRDASAAAGQGRLEELVFLNLLKTTDILSRALVELLKPAGLSATQYNVLRILRGAGAGGLSCQQIGGKMLTRDPDLTRLLDRLEARGLVARQRRGDDRRVVCSTLTVAGRQMLAPLDGPLMQMHRRLLRHMKPAGLKQLVHLLQEARGQTD